MLLKYALNKSQNQLLQAKEYRSYIEDFFFDELIYRGLNGGYLTLTPIVEDMLHSN